MFFLKNLIPFVFGASPNSLSGPAPEIADRRNIPYGDSRGHRSTFFRKNSFKKFLGAFAVFSISAATAQYRDPIEPVALSGTEFLERVSQMTVADCSGPGNVPRRVEFRYLRGATLDADFLRAMGHLRELGCLPDGTEIPAERWRAVTESVRTATYRIQTTDARTLSYLDRLRRWMGLPNRTIIFARLQGKWFAPVQLQNVVTTTAGFMIGTLSNAVTAPAHARVWAGALLMAGWLTGEVLTTIYQQGARALPQAVTLSPSSPGGIRVRTGLSGTIGVSTGKNVAWFALSELAMLSGTMMENGQRSFEVAHFEWWVRTFLNSMAQAVAFFPLEAWVNDIANQQRLAAQQHRAEDAARLQVRLFWRIFFVYSVAMSAVEVTGFMATHAGASGSSGATNAIGAFVHAYGGALTPMLAIAALFYQRDQIFPALKGIFQAAFGMFANHPPATEIQTTNCVVSGIMSATLGTLTGEAALTTSE